jgi:phage terminase small subunit
MVGYLYHATRTAQGGEKRETIHSTAQTGKPYQTKEKNTMNRLTQKQETFCLAYVETGNASEAYRRAYSTKNMKPATVNDEASKVLRSPHVSHRVQELKKAVQERTEITIDAIVKELAAVGFIDVKQIYHDNGTLKQPQELEADTAKAIQEITVKRTVSEHGEITETVKYKLHNKLQALDMLMRYLGGYEKDNRQKDNTVIVVGEPKAFL